PDQHNLAGRDGRSIRIPGVLGYELRYGGSVLATMDLVDGHRIDFARDMPPELRPAVAATLVVLMFFNLPTELPRDGKIGAAA
ncbi:MAG: hypothetical protein ACREXP_12975, partial [Steroidobacteraceae bacterium]